MALRNVVPIANVLHSINPATGELMGTYPIDAEPALQQKLQLAGETFLSWRQTTFSERSRLMLRAAELLEEEKKNLARLMTLEMGKTLRAAVQEAEKCAAGCRFYAENAQRLLASEPVQTDATRSYVRYQPLGAVLAIMPWNFPFWQVFRFAAPSLMAGNVGLLKHASNVPQCALAIQDIFRRAGFPEGVFQTLLIGSDEVADVIGDPRVAAVTLTGSVGAGSSVAAAAGKLIKKTVLELGGSDPFIVMPSTDVARTANMAVEARTINNGQSCIAAKRFIVHQAIYREFESRFVERMAALKVGDPLDESTDIGPLATDDVLSLLEDQVKRTVQMGARLLLGGKRVDRKGNFYSPTVLADLPPGSPPLTEELFGPVASLFRVGGIEEALAVANNTPFGLGSSCWTEDQREREYFAEHIEAGLAFVNGMVASHPRAPFGGIKQSGYGRELSVQGIREFVNVKTVSIYETEGRGSSDTE